MLKKYLFQVTYVVIIFVSSLGLSSASTFSDMENSHVNNDAIEYVRGNGIVSGYPDGTYRPDKTINRVEFTKIIVASRFSDSDINNCVGSNIPSNWSYVFFPDVEKDTWYAKYICMAKVNNIIQGYPDGLFRPDNDINFAEAAKIIVNTFGYSVSTGQNWYQSFVEKLGEKKAIPTTIADFNKKITRGEMAEIVYRLMASVTDKTYATYDSINGGYKIKLNSEPEPSDAEPIKAYVKIKTIVLLIDPNIYKGTKSSLKQFRSDLELEGYNVVIKVSTMQTPEEIRGYLANLYETVSPGLVGAFLIGDIQRPHYRLNIPSDDECPGRGPEEYISFQFYQDLDGSFGRLDPGACINPGCYDSHTGKIDSEIWISVLPFAIDTADTINKINYYFQKNHDYRLGINRPKKGYLRPLIASQIDTLELYKDQLDFFINSEYAWKPLATRGNVGVFIDNSIGYPNARDGYETAILSGDYDFVDVGGHGTPVSLGISGGSITLTTDWVNTHSIKSTFVWSTSCNNGDIDFIDKRTGKKEQSLLAEFVYSNGSVLLAAGATGSYGGLGANINGYFRPNIGRSLADGKSMGEAFLNHINAPFKEGCDLQQREYFVVPTIFIGDLTLKLQEYMKPIP